VSVWSATKATDACSNGIDIDEALAKYNQTCQEMKSLKDNSAANKTLVKVCLQAFRLLTI